MKFTELTKNQEENEALTRKLTMKEHECDLLNKQLFEVNRQMKIAGDRIKQLEDDNQYRKEVVKLEKALQIKEDFIRDLQEEFRRCATDKADLSVRLKTICEDKEKEGVKYQECIAVVSRLKHDIGEREMEIRQLKVDFDESYNDMKQDLNERIVKTEELEVSLQEQQEENSRLRTENVQLKNKVKVDQKDGAENELGTTEQELAGAIVSLAEAMESLNCRLEAQETLLKDHCHQIPPQPQVTKPTQPQPPSRPQPLPRPLPQSLTLPCTHSSTPAQKQMSSVTQPPKILPQPSTQQSTQPLTHSYLSHPSAISSHSATSYPVPETMLSTCEPSPQLQKPATFMNPQQYGQPIQKYQTVQKYHIESQPQSSISSQRNFVPPPTFKHAVSSFVTPHHTTDAPQPSASSQKTTMIISDSTPTRINNNQIKKNIDVSKESVIFKKFPGHTASEIAYYAPKPLGDCKPHQVVIIAGTNSLARELFENNTVDEYKVVNEILDIARAARNSGAVRIHVSSILPRRGFRYRDVVGKVNDLLFMACVAEDFSFLDQVGITLDHIAADGIHPSFYGSTILKYNILSVFDTFDRNFMDFRHDYEKAIC